MDQDTPVNTTTAPSTDLDVGMDTLQMLVFLIGNILLLLLVAIMVVGAGALSGMICRHMRRTKSTEDKFGEGLPFALPVANVFVFVVVGMLLAFIHDEQVKHKEPVISFIGCLGMLLLVELVFTLVVGAAIMGYTVIEGAVQSRTEESAQLRSRTGSHDDEESATGAKQDW